LWEAVYRFMGGEPPQVDLAGERRLVDYLVAGAERGLFHSAHDCSQGGLGVALAEIAMGGPYAETGFGLDVNLTAYAVPLAALELLFSESHGRAVVTCAPERAAAVAALAQELGVLATRVGTVGERGGAVGFRLRDGRIEHPVDRLRQVYFSAVPRRMGD
jgi:phosphoribosylformylglycinamidine synthase